MKNFTAKDNHFLKFSVYLPYFGVNLIFCESSQLSSTLVGTSFPFIFLLTLFCSIWFHFQKFLPWVVPCPGRELLSSNPLFCGSPCLTSSIHPVASPLHPSAQTLWFAVTCFYSMVCAHILHSLWLHTLLVDFGVFYLVVQSVFM